METKKITISVITTDRGKTYISAEAIKKQLNAGVYKKGTLYEMVYPKSNIIKFTGDYYGEYSDNPEDDIHDIEFCIEDGTEIVGRRKDKSPRK